jgi:hypothetical protein
MFLLFLKFYFLCDTLKWFKNIKNKNKKLFFYKILIETCFQTKTK